MRWGFVVSFSVLSLYPCWNRDISVLSISRGVVYLLYPLLGMVYWNHCVCVSRVCPEDSFRTTQCFINKLGMVVHHYQSESHTKI